MISSRGYAEILSFIVVQFVSVPFAIAAGQEEPSHVQKPQDDWLDTETEHDIIGRWVSKDGHSKVIVNEFHRVIEAGKPTGRLEMPCCGNFRFRRESTAPDFIYDTCSYWVYFDKKKDISFWKLLRGRLTEECPSGIFYRK